jgi:hypothetical protein
VLLLVAACGTAAFCPAAPSQSLSGIFLPFFLLGEILNSTGLVEPHHQKFKRARAGRNYNKFN